MYALRLNCGPAAGGAVCSCSNSTAKGTQLDAHSDRTVLPIAVLVGVPREGVSPADELQLSRVDFGHGWSVRSTTNERRQGR